jgi:glycosyltransferase involved in cell wall biosynthesis
MAAGRPVICSDVGAMPELVQHGETGVVVPSGNEEALARAMENLLGDRAAAERLAVSGHARARETYHTPLVVPRIMAAYEDASDYFYQVRAAGGAATAGQWRRAIVAGASIG